MSDDKKPSSLEELLNAAQRFKKEGEQQPTPDEITQEQQQQGGVQPTEEPITVNEAQDKAEEDDLVVVESSDRQEPAQKKSLLKGSPAFLAKLNTKQKIGGVLIAVFIIMGIFGGELESPVQPDAEPEALSSTVSAASTESDDDSWITVNDLNDSMDINFDLPSSVPAQEKSEPAPAPKEESTVDIVVEESSSNSQSQEVAITPDVVGPDPLDLPEVKVQATPPSDHLKPESLLPPVAAIPNDLDSLPVPEILPAVVEPSLPPATDLPEFKNEAPVFAQNGEKDLSMEKKVSKEPIETKSKPVTVTTKPKATTSAPRVAQAITRPMVRDLVIYRASPNCDICVPHAYFRIGNAEHEVGDGLQWEGYTVSIIGDRMTLSKKDKSFDYWYR